MIDLKRFKSIVKEMKSDGRYDANKKTMFLQTVGSDIDDRAVGTFYYNQNEVISIDGEWRHIPVKFEFHNSSRKPDAPSDYPQYIYDHKSVCTLTFTTLGIVITKNTDCNIVVSGNEEEIIKLIMLI